MAYTKHAVFCGSLWLSSKDSGTTWGFQNPFLAVRTMQGIVQVRTRLGEGQHVQHHGAGAGRQEAAPEQAHCQEAAALHARSCTDMPRWETSAAQCCNPHKGTAIQPHGILHSTALNDALA